MTLMLTGTVPVPLPLDEIEPWNATRQMLVCTSVVDEAPEVKTFTFAVEDGGWFRYMPGQFITVELRTKDGDLHRTYTVSSSPSRPYAISITVKAQPTSVGTRWMFENVRPGSRIRAYGPNGHFSLMLHPAKKYLFISAGSGITPMMSMLRWLFDCDPGADVTFVNSSRRPEDIIFRDELEMLARRMPNLTIGFLPEMRSAVSPWGGLMGRVDRHKLALLAPDFMRREIFCCGPEPFMSAVSGIVRSEGFDMAHFHQESFGASSFARPAQMEGEERNFESTSSALTVTFLGTNKRGDCAPGQTILEAARNAGVRIPSACQSGICGTCRVFKRSGDVEMRHNGGISQQDISSGYVLACCSRPLSPIEVDA